MQNKNAVLEHILVFQKAANVFGNELSGELISNLSWSPNGCYIAATMNSCLNIWTFSTSECYIEDHSSTITAIAWPRGPREKSGDDEQVQYLLVGKADGTVSLVTIRSNSKFSREDLTNCSEQCKQQYLYKDALITDYFTIV